MIPTASIVIPCFNVEDTIDAQLDRLLPQIERIGAELVLVDNNSTDQTAIRLNKHADRPDVTITQATERQSVAHARNVGASTARSDRLLFCDADDIVGPDWVETMATSLDDGDVITGLLDVTTLNGPSLRRSRGPTDQAATFYGLFPIAHGGNMAVARRVWDEIGPLDETLASIEDVEWSLRAHVAGHKIARNPEAIVQYRYRQSARALWRQGLAYGRHRPLVARMTYERLGSRPGRFAGARSWIWLLCNLGLLRNADGRARFAWVAGNRLGNLLGSIHARFLVL